MRWFENGKSLLRQAFSFVPHGSIRNIVVATGPVWEIDMLSVISAGGSANKCSYGCGSELNPCGGGRSEGGSLA
ncbi:hypothetical protein [Dickeya fangzhongdai]|uniref:hypothetical protein n=1 Tax=Dickeya fangzhongdai TaxID=1778540 RepID=UPI0004F6A634|nr:hypothetical protein [Dickeya fangzhongdai]AIR68131.1 hypothetical protein LH89_02510 [Dickeya fangzhongdai]KGT96548.1 hypothetical protein NM75_19685 [Dickeya fangzhongdai]